MFACNICRIYIIYSNKCNVGHKTSGGYLQLSAKYDVLYLKFVHKVFNQIHMWRGSTCVNNINKDSKYDTSGGDPQLSYKRRDIMK